MAVAELIRFEVDGGGELVVQATVMDVLTDQGNGSPSGELMPAGNWRKKTGDKVREASDTLQDVLGKVRPGLQALATELRKLTPDEMAVEFGLALSGETGVVVVKGAGEVHFLVTLKWAPEPGAGKAERDAGESMTRETT